MRVLLFAPLLALVFLAGVWVGRGRRRKALHATADAVTGVLRAARGAAAVDWLAQPREATLSRMQLQLALDEYDAHRRALD